jgi:AcrR family transcriptional regulator
MSQFRSDARRNRDAVIESAVRLLSDRPHASVSEIADASGVGRTTVYRHFPTRETLLRALIDRAVEDSRAIITMVISSPDPPLQVVRTLGPQLVTIGTRYRFLVAHGREEAALEPLAPYLESAREHSQLRDDLPIWWMLAVLRGLSIAAVDEVVAGRAESVDAGRLLGTTLAAAFAPRA